MWRGKVHTAMENIEYYQDLSYQAERVDSNCVQSQCRWPQWWENKDTDGQSMFFPINTK